MMPCSTVGSASFLRRHAALCIILCSFASASMPRSRFRGVPQPTLTKSQVARVNLVKVVRSLRRRRICHRDVVWKLLLQRVDASASQIIGLQVSSQVLLPVVTNNLTIDLTRVSDLWDAEPHRSPEGTREGGVMLSIHVLRVGKPS